MSFIQSLAAASTRVLVLPAPNGASLYVRIRRPTAGDAIGSGATGLAQPEPSADDKAIAETVNKRRAALRSRAAQSELEMAAYGAQARILHLCVTHIGSSAESMEPVTILCADTDTARPGSEGLPIASLLPEWVFGIATALWNAEAPGGWSELTAAAFPGADVGGDRRDGADVGSAA